ncbi:MAG: class I SAM-dependent methyltransferase [Bacillota bacterium]|nr:class I SAM-dependent methyltransferase [Bacillota bacterium]
MALKRPGEFNITDRALEIANFKMGSRILDIGCGQGDTVNHLNELGLKAEGIEMNLSDIQIAKERYPGIDVKFGDGSFLDDYTSFTFDGVTFECSLSMINQPDEALHEAYCVMKKGGRLIITDLYEIDPDPKQVKAVEIEADRQARIPHQEGDCDEGTVMRFVNFRYEGAFFKEQLIRMVEEEIGYKVLAFEDRTEDLNNYVAQTLMDEGSLDNICSNLKWEINGKKRKIGYFILVAQKPIA